MDYLEAKVDKFVFRVARDCRYSDADVWVTRAGKRARVGLTDYLQSKSGDVAFVNLKAIGAMLATNDELAVIETVKVDLVIPMPLAGEIVAVNDALAEHPELVNCDPYGAGWLAEIELSNPVDYDALLDAQAYLPQMQARAGRERGK